MEQRSWEQRLERDIEDIDDIVKWDIGILSKSSYWKIRNILKKLIEDVQIATLEDERKQ